MKQKHPLAKWRKTNSVTQEELAETLAVSRWTINSIETGRRNSSLSLARKLQEITDISLDDIFAGKKGKTS